MNSNVIICAYDASYYALCTTFPENIYPPCLPPQQEEEGGEDARRRREEVGAAAAQQR